MMKRIGALLMVSVLFVLAGCTHDGAEVADTNSPAIQELASCLTANGATFYGTDRCPHCKEQKRLFGPAIDAVNFVDCDANSGQCAAAGVKGYPTWVFADGSQLVGTQSLETLANKAGCSFAPEALVPSGDQNTQMLAQ